MNSIYKGVLIDQSVTNPGRVLEYATITGNKETLLEGESSRGKVLFYNIEVAKENLWNVLSEVAQTIKGPGWYFHLVGDSKLYIVMPSAILIAENNDGDLNKIVDYAVSHNIHPDQLNLKQLFDNPFA